MAVSISNCAGEKETFNDPPTLKETASPLSTQATEESATPSPAQVGTVETQTPLPATPVPATPTPLSDGTYVWKWGAWRDPVTDAAYVAPTPLPTALAPVVASQGYSYGSGVEQWRGLVASIFPAWAVDTVLRIMQCESGGNPGATGSAGERGLMQIHPIHYDSTYDPTGNLLAAYRISSGGSSWAAWTCR